MSNLSVTSTPGSAPDTVDDSVTFHLAEQGSVGVTLTHATFTLLPLGAALPVDSSAIAPGVPGAPDISANGTLDSIVTLRDAPVSSIMRVDIAYVDNRGVSGSVSGTTSIKRPSSMQKPGS